LTPVFRVVLIFLSADTAKSGRRVQEIQIFVVENILKPT
jgi:hypothetical protein